VNAANAANAAGAAGAAGAASPGTHPGAEILSRLTLSRGTVDRAAHRRTDTGWLDAAWADPRTRVLVIDDGRALVRFRGAEAGLVLVPPGQAPDGLRFLLGVDADDVVYFGVLGPLPEGAAHAWADGPGAGTEREAPGGAAADVPAAAAGAAGAVVAAAGDGSGGRPSVRPAGLRSVGELLGDRDAGLMTHAVALANWHEVSTHCSRCGAETQPHSSGHARRCPVDGSDHFPRLDPAVIMLVTDPADRCLLARNAAWPERRVSILAGFVEPGESAEHAVAREVQEETGIEVAPGQVEYLASQPWPMPHSLMLGFRVRATGSLHIEVDREEIAEARWYSRDELRAAIESGELLLPPPVSIAHRIIEDWYGEDLPGSW
jgi:NAD+ diphosphatase